MSRIRYAVKSASQTWVFASLEKAYSFAFERSFEERVGIYEADALLEMLKNGRTEL